MKLHSILRLSPSKRSRFSSITTTTTSFSDDLNVFDDVITILNNSNNNNNSPIESALDSLLPFLNPGLVSSILREELNPLKGFRFFIWAIQKERLCSRESENLIIDKLCTDKTLFDLYWQVIEQSRNSGVSICSDAFLVLITAYSQLGNAGKAVESFSKMKEFECKPAVFTYNAILHVLFRREFGYLALAVYRQMLKSPIKANVATFSIMINGLQKCGDTDAALKIIYEMNEQEIMPNTVTYTNVISLLCQVKKVDDALRICRMMRDSGCLPDSITYNTLINGFCKLGRINEALAHLKTFEEDGFVLGLNGYSCLIDGLFKAGRYKQALSLYGKLIILDIKGDTILHAIMLRWLCEAGKVKEAMRLLYEMSGRGVTPDTYCYNAVIKGFCDMGELDKAESLKLEISKNGCFPNPHTYSILISGMCKKGLVDDALKIYSEMEKIGCSPSVVTFNSLINGLCEAGEHEKAQHLFRKIEIRKNLSLLTKLSQGANGMLDTASLKQRVNELCESGFINEAYKLLVQQEDSGVAPDIVTYNIRINDYCKARNMDAAMKLLTELVLCNGLSPSFCTYGTLIDGFYMVDRENDALKMFHKMEETGCPPDPSIYRSLMTWSCRKKKISSAFHLWLDYLKKVGRNEQKIKNIEKHFVEGKVGAAVHGLLEMDFQLKDFDLAPYTIWLIGLCQVGRIGEALEIFSILEAHKIIVTPPSCVQLINCLCNINDLHKALDIFHYSLDNKFLLRQKICYKLLASLLNSKDEKGLVFGILERMESSGYDMNLYRPFERKARLYIPRNLQETEFASLR
ncbi:hypothetical protein ACFE04_030404 [Oxalis oulophora]